MYNSNQESSATLFSYLYIFYEREFSERLSKLESEFDSPKIEEFFQDVLVFNKDSMLSYTASPQSPLNQRILALANRFAHQKQTHPLCVLRPDLSTECIQNPDQKKPGTSIYPNLNDPQVLVETILSQYISGDPGRTYWIPVKILAECSIQESTHKLPNYYCDFALPEEQRGTGYLTEFEVQRLYHFSPQTRQLWELRKNYAELLESDLSLLAQLNILLRNMRFNSKSYGHGTELDAGLGAYLALIRFLEYYNSLNNPSFSIPSEIQNEIHFLRDLTSNPTININATTETQTCMSLRYESLLRLVQNHKEELARVHPQAVDAKGQTLLKIEQDYRQIQNDLVMNFQQGHDPLGVSVPLVALCQNHIQIHSESDLHLFLNSFPEKEYARLLGPQATNKNLRQSILWVLRANNLNQLIPNLVILLVELQPQKGRAFLAEFPEISAKLKTVPMAFSEILLSFEEEKFQALVEGFSPDVLFYYLDNSQELKDLNLFSEDKRGYIYSETMKLADAIQDFESCMQIYPKIQGQENKQKFIEKVGLEKLVSFVTDAGSFSDIFKHLTEDLRAQFMAVLGLEKLVSFVRDFESFEYVFVRMQIYSKIKGQEKQFMEKVGLEKLISFVRDTNSFRRITAIIPDGDLRNQFVEKGTEKLVSLVTNLDSFRLIADDIRDKDLLRNFEVKSLEKLASFVTDASSFLHAHYLLIEDLGAQFTAVLGLEKLVSFARDEQSFLDILNYLTEDLRAQFMAVLGLEKLVSFVRDASFFCRIAHIIPDGNLRNQFVEKGIDKLVSLATDLFSFRSTAYAIRDKDLFRNFEVKGLEKLTSFVRDAESFSDIFKHLTEDLRAQFMAVLGLEKLVSFVEGTNSFLSITAIIPDGDLRNQFVEKGTEKLVSLVRNIFSFRLIADDIRDKDLLRNFEVKSLEKLASFVRDAESFSDIFKHLTEDLRAQFMAVLGSEKLVSFVTDFKSFRYVFDSISDEDLRNQFLEKGIEKLVSFVTNLDSFRLIADDIRDKDLLRNFEVKGIEKLASFVTDASSFLHGHSPLRKDLRPQFMAVLGLEKLASFVRDAESFSDIFKHLTEDLRAQFMAVLSFEKLATFVTDASSFVEIAFFLRKDLISDVTDASSFAEKASFPREDLIPQFMAVLSFEKLASFARDARSFAKIAYFLRDDLRVQFMAVLSLEKLASFITNKESFLDIVSLLRKDLRPQFMAVLGLEKLATFVTDDRSFEEIVSFLTEDLRKPFMTVLGLEELVSFVSSSSLETISKNISDEVMRGEFLDLGIKKLASLATDGACFGIISKSIEDVDLLRKFIKEVKIEKLVSFVTNANSFRNIAYSISDEDLRNQFLEKGIEKLVSFVTDVDSFNTISNGIIGNSDHFLHYENDNFDYSFHYEDDNSEDDNSEDFFRSSDRWYYVTPSLDNEDLRLNFLEKTIVDILQSKLEFPESIRILEKIIEHYRYAEASSIMRCIEKNSSPIFPKGLEPLLNNKEALSDLFSKSSEANRQWLVSQLNNETLLDFFNFCSCETRKQIFDRSSSSQKEYLNTVVIIESKQNSSHSSLYSSSVSTMKSPMSSKDSVAKGPGR